MSDSASVPPEAGALPDGMHRLRLEDGRAAIAKRRRDAPDGFFAAEARGLAALRDAHCLRVPAVYAVDAQAIVLEDLGRGQPGARDWEQAGTRLAALHRLGGECFGFRHDGWCGDTPQDNAPDDDGHRFFAERRLLPQAARARQAGRLSAGEVARIEQIAARLADWLPAAPPVLVHGDLWTGNLHGCASGELALIDGGAVHHGWAEADLAMLTLFGEPPRAFFAAYESASRADGSWRTRAPLLNLYHLLNHLNLFGAAYLASVRQVLARYA